MTARLLIVSYLLLLALPEMLQAGSVSLSGTGADEVSGDGWALVIPDLDATSPGVYDPVEVAPKNPFNIGTITWDDASVPATGAATLPVSNAMCAWNLAEYVQDVINQLAAIGTGSVNITLSSIVGPGLTFKNGVLESIDFTAAVSWTPTFNGFPASQSYYGTLTFVNGVFTWNMSSNTANWFIGATDVHFLFDLRGTVAGLARPILPAITLTETGPDQFVLHLNYALPSTAAFRVVSNDTLTGPWTQVGDTFTTATAPASLPLVTTGLSRRFYRVERVSP